MGGTCGNFSCSVRCSHFKLCQGRSHNTLKHHDNLRIGNVDDKGQRPGVVQLVLSAVVCGWPQETSLGCLQRGVGWCSVDREKHKHLADSQLGLMFVEAVDARLVVCLASIQQPAGGVAIDC